MEAGVGPAQTGPIQETDGTGLPANLPRGVTWAHNVGEGGRGLSRALVVVVRVQGGSAVNRNWNVGMTDAPARSGRASLAGGGGKKEGWKSGCYFCLPGAHRQVAARGGTVRMYAPGRRRFPACSVAVYSIPT